MDTMARVVSTMLEILGSLLIAVAVWFLASWEWGLFVLAVLVLAAGLLLDRGEA